MRLRHKDTQSTKYRLRTSSIRHYPISDVYEKRRDTLVIYGVQFSVSSPALIHEDHRIISVFVVRLILRSRLDINLQLLAHMKGLHRPVRILVMKLESAYVDERFVTIFTVV